MEFLSGAGHDHFEILAGNDHRAVWDVPRGAEPPCQTGVELPMHFFAAHLAWEHRSCWREQSLKQSFVWRSLASGRLPTPLTQQELVAKLESAGYSQIRDIKSTAEGTAVKAMKNGKEVSLVVDSGGQIKERQQ